MVFLPCAAWFSEEGRPKADFGNSAQLPPSWPSSLPLTLASWSLSWRQIWGLLWVLQFRKASGQEAGGIVFGSSSWDCSQMSSCLTAFWVFVQAPGVQMACYGGDIRGHPGAGSLECRCPRGQHGSSSWLPSGIFSLVVALGSGLFYRCLQFCGFTLKDLNTHSLHLV